MCTAADIPVAKIPPGGWHGEMPPPVLAGCTEPLVPEAPDLRGMWEAYRVQEGDRLLIDHRLTDSPNASSSAATAW